MFYRLISYVLVASFMSQTIAFAVDPVSSSLNSQDAKMMIARVEERLNTRLQSLPEKKRESVTYGMYKVGVKAYNKILNMSDTSWNTKKESAANKLIKKQKKDDIAVLESQEEKDMVEFVGSHSNEVTPKKHLSVAASELKNLSRTDALGVLKKILEKYETPENSDGKMMALPKKDFLQNYKVQHPRSPAQADMIGGIIMLLFVGVLIGSVVLAIVSVVALGPILGTLVAIVGISGLIAYAWK